MLQPSEHEIEVFNVALELPVRERAEYLDKACGGDAALRQRIEELLQASKESCPCLEGPVASSPGPSGTVRLALSPIEKPGDRIGRYKLLQQIGEGGCGVVYMAEQEEPVRRRVALKVIKLGMDTKSVIARFEAERQALALMDHPNIAKVLDAGATDTGRPYFVMELVRGIKITDYCDQNNLSTQERLDLFIQVCRAIQHAHQKGIIHRDIKPSNILVTMNDGVPLPKVIDFGIAKATHGKLTDQTVFTAFEQFIGTPAYMSPEQAEMSALDIDTRSDIYSLGVLLYELLTGQTPFDAKKLLQAGLDEIRRTIREQEPARPSTCLSTMLGADLTGTAKHRNAEPFRLVHLVRGDLDWIVMKALEKDRTRRYETANGLAADIQRHLSNEPVVARPPSNLYRFQKLVRRNKLAFTAMGAVSAALVLGVVASTAEAIRAKRAEQQQSRLREEAEQSQRVEAQQRHEAEVERRIAETEAAKSRQVSGFLEQMFRGVSPWVASGRDMTVLREILDKAAARLSSDLTNQPEVELELRNTIGQVYLELDDRTNAEAVLRDAPAMARKLWGNDDLRLTTPLQELAGAFVGPNAKPKEAEVLQREVLAIRRKALGNESAAVGQSLRDVANVLRIEGRLVEAEKTEREALEIQWKLWPQGHPEVAASLFVLALVLREEGRWPEAESADRQALAMYTKMSGEENPDVAGALGELGYVLRSEGKLAEAEPLLRRALAMQTKLYGNEYPGVASTLDSIAAILRDEGKLVEAEQAKREELAIQRKLYGSEHPDLIPTLNGLCGTLDAEGKFPEAESFLRENVAIQKKFPGKEEDVVATLGWLSWILEKDGKLPEEESTLREILALQRKLLGNENPGVLQTVDRLKRISGREGKPQ